MTKAEFAKLMGITKELLNQIIKGKAAITPKIALKLEAVFQLPAHFWMNLEQQYQETLARLQLNKTDKNTRQFFNEIISSARYLVNTSGGKTDVVFSCLE